MRKRVIERLNYPIRKDGYCSLDDKEAVFTAPQWSLWLSFNAPSIEIALDLERRGTFERSLLQQHIPYPLERGKLAVDIPDKILYVFPRLNDCILQ